MVVARSISTDPEALLGTEVSSVETLSTITSPPEFGLEREVSFFSSVCEHLVNSPSGSDTSGDAFLDDENEDQSETDVFECTSAHRGQGSITNT